MKGMKKGGKKQERKTPITPPKTPKVTKQGSKMNLHETMPYIVRRQTQKHQFSLVSKEGQTLFF